MEIELKEFQHIYKILFNMDHRKVQEFLVIFFAHSCYYEFRYIYKLLYYRRMSYSESRTSNPRIAKHGDIENQYLGELWPQTETANNKVG